MQKVPSASAPDDENQVPVLDATGKLNQFVAAPLY